MPIVENPILYGGKKANWKKVRTTQSARCLNPSCRKVHPGKYVTELKDGLCLDCQRKEK